MYPPQLTVDTNSDDIYFFNKDKKINSFYDNFTSWTFTNFLKNIKSLENILDKIAPSMVNFDISEYHDIPDANKTPDLGYKIEAVGKLYVVGFLNEDIVEFKIQVVCKIQSASISIIDHVVEIIIPLPESSLYFSPSSDSYSPPKYTTINLASKTYNLQNYDSLIYDNIDAYIKRKGAYGASNESQVIHKSINHIARIFYLYELIYKNMDKLNMDELNLLFIFGMNENNRSQTKTLYYYKIVDGVFHKISVDTRFFINSYLEIVKQNTYVYNTFNRNRNNSGYLMGSANSQEIQQMHDSFITELFNDNLFKPSGLLTFPTSTSGGKRRYKKNKTRNYKNKTKKNKTKKNKTKKNSKRKITRKYKN